MEQFANNGRHQRCRNTECSRGTSKKCKYSQKVNNPASPSIGMLSQNRAASFRIFLTVSFSHMEHKAKGNSQHKIEPPRNKAPVEQRIYACPILDTTHLCQMRIGCIQHPLRERIEQNICCKTTGKHHGAPRKEGIFRLLILLTKDDVAILRTGNIQRKDKNPQSNYQVICTKGITKEKTYLAQYGIRLFRRKKE